MIKPTEMCSKQIQCPNHEKWAVVGLGQYTPIQNAFCYYSNGLSQIFHYHSLTVKYGCFKALAAVHR